MLSNLSIIKISLIVPVYNEEKELPRLISNLLYWQQQGADVVVVDGGSQDKTVLYLEKAGLLVVHSQKGRARQMNAGAKVAKGNIFLFLHADTILPANALMQLQRVFSHTALDIVSRHSHWGRFDVQIISDIGLLKIVSMMINLRSRMTAIATGDQAIFISRVLFDHIGGFPQQPLMEDVELCKRLKKQKFSPVYLANKVQTSGRRWEKYGVWKTIFLMWRLRWQYWRGVSATDLAKDYL